MTRPSKRQAPVGDPATAPPTGPKRGRISRVPRPVRARVTSGLAVFPALVSDLTAAAVVGLEPRQFREWLRIAGIPHVVVGHRAIARVEAVLEAVERLSTAPVGLADKACEESGSDSEPTVDQLLAQVGRRRAAP